MTTGILIDLFITQGCNSNTNHKLQEDSYRDKGLFVASNQVKRSFQVLPVTSFSFLYFIFPRIVNNPSLVNEFHKKKAGESNLLYLFS